MYNLFSNIDNLIKEGVPTLTTCAGTILVANKVIDGSPCIPNISITVHRNAYGRQNESFEGSVKFLDNNDIYCFIRAPKIVDYEITRHQKALKKGVFRQLLYGYCLQ